MQPYLVSSGRTCFRGDSSVYSGTGGNSPGDTTRIPKDRDQTTTIAFPAESRAAVRGEEYGALRKRDIENANYEKRMKALVSTRISMRGYRAVFVSIGGRRRISRRDYRSL